MKKLTKGVNKILGIFLSILMAAMVLDVSWQVFTRFFTEKPSSFTEELAGFLLIWIGLLGASYALYTKAHLGIDVLTYKLRGKKKQVAEIIIFVIVGLFAFFVMVYGGTRLVQLTFSLKQVSAAMEIKMGYVYLVIPLSGILMIYFCIGFILDAIKGEIIEHHASAID